MMRGVTSPSLQQLVLKVHSRCDLACDHCYVYEHADQGWRARPVVISEEALTQTARRFAAYAEAHRLPSVAIILHGGEPLLCGPARLRRICAELTRSLAPVTSLDLQIHTNGIQLSRRHLDVFAEFGVKVGISLDGDRAANDRHRLDRRGRSSYDRVLRGIELLRTPEYRHLFGGLLGSEQVQLTGAAPASRWRPLETVRPPGRPPLLIDDADPYRDCFPAPLAAGPTPASFAERLLRAYELLDARLPRWSEDRNAFHVTTVTPLAPGSGLRLGGHGPGALGVAVDFTPEEFVRELPRLGRRTRFTSLRETSDLNVLGNRAGRLLDEAFEQLGNSRHEDAVRALVELTALPERELTETGAVLAAQLWTEWATHA